MPTNPYEPPKERILPRVEQPPELTPGIPLEYATSMVLDGFATGLEQDLFERLLDLARAASAASGRTTPEVLVP